MIDRIIERWESTNQSMTSAARLGKINMIVNRGTKLQAIGGS